MPLWLTRIILLTKIIMNKYEKRFNLLFDSAPIIRFFVPVLFKTEIKQNLTEPKHKHKILVQFRVIMQNIWFAEKRCYFPLITTSDIGKMHVKLYRI